MPQHLSSILNHVGTRCLSRHYTSSSIYLRSHDSNDHSKTIFIPRSKFPHRHDPKVELSIQEDSKFAQTYLEQDPSRKPYVIHDGPPFANGQIHLGHAINKILKDIAARYAMITGHRVEFITGWDCHGLPIEMQIFKLLEEQQRQSNYGGSLVLDSETSPEHFRAKARSYAKSQIDLQMTSFKRMGLLTDWNKRYTTDDPSYVANQLRAFSQLFEQKLVFKDLMPSNWSIVNKTTLADADIDFRSNHISKSAYVLYEIIDPPFSVEVPGEPIYSLLWTTTPWNLLENQAIAFNKQETYCILRVWNDSQADSKNLLVSLDTLWNVQNLLQRLGYQNEMKTYVSGRSLIGLHYKPLLDSLIPNNENNVGKPLPFLHGDFVDCSKGTGLVHISPNYGYDDFILMRKNKLSIKKGLIDQDGKFCDEVGEQLAGKFIFSDGNQEILNLVDQCRALLFTENFQHTYPYETRTNQPIMVRASQQIFLDTSRIIPRCLKALECSSFYPDSYKQHLKNTLISSPYWCISRQRLWGTPIPVLYATDDVDQAKMISHPLLVENICKLLYKKRSMDYWWAAGNEELFPQELLDKCKIPYESKNLVRSMDIFDVWSDSGLSWHTTANSLTDSKNQADLYLEGKDQIRGWFSASCILSIALRGCLPSKRFFLHGFAVDEYGRKMSKSQGNVVDPLDLFERYGVDPVRFWAAKEAGSNQDVRVKPDYFKKYITESIKKIRNTLKYLIGALADHDAIDNKLDHAKLEIFDQYYLDKLYRFGSKVDSYYKRCRYDCVVKSVYKFVSTDLSAIYITTTKDLLYCDSSDSARRKSCLTVLNLTYNILLRCLYPLTPHIVHEAGEHMRPSEPLNEWQDLGYKATWKNDVLHEQLSSLIKLRGILMNITGPRFDQLADQDSVLFVSDKKLYKQISKLTNTNHDLMKELFKTSTFTLSYVEKLTQPENVQVILNDKLIRGCDEAPGETKVRHEEEGEEDDDELNMQLLTSWTSTTAQGYRVGGSVSIGNGAPMNFEMSYKKSINSRCSRCRRYTVLDNVNICDRCKESLHKLELLD